MARCIICGKPCRSWAGIIHEPCRKVRLDDDLEEMALKRMKVAVQRRLIEEIHQETLRWRVPE